MAAIVALRIPKAGSGALVIALRDLGELPDHEYRLADVPDGDLAFAVLRDPVERFRSAYDMYHNDGTGDMAARFPTVDDFIQAGPDEWLDPVWGSAFWHATWWLRDADYVRERGAIVLAAETFADDLAAMGFSRPPIMHAAFRRSVVGERERAFLQHTYSDDYELREALCHRS